MALNPIRIRRSIAAIGATPEQADEFTEALQEGVRDLVTRDDLARALSELEDRIVNRLRIAMLAMAAVIIAVTALLTRV